MNEIEMPFKTEWKWNIITIIIFDTTFNIDEMDFYIKIIFTDCILIVIY